MTSQANPHSVQLKRALDTLLTAAPLDCLDSKAFTDVSKAATLYAHDVTQCILTLQHTGFECIASVLTEITNTKSPPQAWRDIHQHRICALTGKLVQRVICVSPFMQIDHDLHEIAVSLYVCTHMSEILQDMLSKEHSSARESTSEGLHKTLNAFHGAIDTVDSTILSLTTQQAPKTLHNKTSPVSV